MTEKEEQLARIAFEELWMLNPSGNKEGCFVRVTLLFEYNEVDEKGELWSWPKLIKKYQEYLAFLNPRQGSQPSYTPKEFRIKNIRDWIEEGQHMQTWESPRKARDNYLFGPYSFEQHEEGIKKFDEWINKRKRGKNG